MPEKNEMLLERLFDFDVEECGSEPAALLREAELIEMFQPPINSQMVTRPGDPIRRGQQRIDLDAADPALLGHQVAEADQQLFEFAQVHRRQTAGAAQRSIDTGLLHHTAGQGRVRRRHPRSASSHFTSLGVRAAASSSPIRS